MSAHPHLAALAEFTLGAENFYDFSVVDGLNMPMDFFVCDARAGKAPIRCRDPG
jgi:hypothetical protein